MLTESEKESLQEMSKIFVHEIFNEQSQQVLLDSLDAGSNNDNNIQNQ